MLLSKKNIVIRCRKEKCQYCEKVLGEIHQGYRLYRTIDHFYPKSRYKLPILKLVSCQLCNTSKSNLDPEHFIIKLQIAKEEKKGYMQIAYESLETVINNTTRFLEAIKFKKTWGYVPIFYKNLESWDGEPKIIDPFKWGTFTCYYCEQKAGIIKIKDRLVVTKDSVRPQSKHPNMSLKVTCCMVCKSAKANYEPELFLAKLQVSADEQQNFGNIDYQYIDTVIKNLTKLVSRIRPIEGYVLPKLLENSPLIAFRMRIALVKGQQFVDRLTDHEIFDMIVVLLSIERIMPEIEIYAATNYFQKKQVNRLIKLLLQIGWLSEYIRNTPIALFKKKTQQYFFVNKSGREIITRIENDALAH